MAEGEVEGEGAGEDEQDDHNEALREDDGGEFGFKDGGNCVGDDAGVGNVDDFTERRQEDQVVVNDVGIGDGGNVVRRIGVIGGILSVTRVFGVGGTDGGVGFFWFFGLFRFRFRFPC